MGVVASDSLGFATSGTAFPFGSAPSVGDYDVLCVNSDTTVSTPTGFTLLDSNVNNQGSYVFYRLAVGGEGTSVTITTTGDHTATAVWGRVRGATGIDKNAKAVAFGSSSATAPTATTAALTETGELALAFVGVHNFSTGTPNTPIWSNSFLPLEEVGQGAGATGCAAFLGYKENVGTAAVSVDETCTNGAFDRDTYVVTFTMDEGQTVIPTGIASGEAFGTPFVRVGYTVLEVQGELNRIAGTSGLGEAGAANSIAGTSGLDVVAALNVHAGNTLPYYLDFQGVANQLAGTTGLGTAEALSRVAPV